MKVYTNMYSMAILIVFNKFMNQEKKLVLGRCQIYYCLKIPSRCYYCLKIPSPAWLSYGLLGQQLATVNPAPELLHLNHWKPSKAPSLCSYCSSLPIFKSRHYAFRSEALLQTTFPEVKTSVRDVQVVLVGFDVNYIFSCVKYPCINADKC